MFIIGKASQDEIDEMLAMGFDVEDVEVKHFNKALDPTLTDEEAEEDIYDEHEDKLVAIFIDCDIVQECRAIIKEEKEELG